MKEFAVWGVPPGQKEETLLVSRLESEEGVQAALKALKEAGCKKLRVQTIDLENPFDAGAAFRKTVQLTVREVITMTEFLQKLAVSGPLSFEQLVEIQKALMLGQPLPYSGPEVEKAAASIQAAIERAERLGLALDLPRD